MGNLVSLRHKKNHVNPPRAAGLQAWSGLSTSFSKQDVTHPAPFSLFFTITPACFSTAPLVLAAHTHTRRRHRVHITLLHYASTVGTVPWLGGESEWSHYTAVTSHSFSLLSNQVSSNNKSYTTTTLLCHPAVVTQCSRLRVNQTRRYFISHHCVWPVWRRCGVFGAVSGVCSWTWGSGRCEFVVFAFESRKARVRKEVRLSSLTEYSAKWLISSQKPSDGDERLGAGGPTEALSGRREKLWSLPAWAHR